MDFFGAVETDEAIHGPRSSAERLSRKMTRKDLEAGRSWLKLRAAKLDKQQPKPFASFLAGVVVYFEGYTKTSAIKLKKMVCNNGGKVSHYFSKSRTTHVVCTNLSTSKRNCILRTRRNVIIVHPDWIVESCRQKRRLAEEPYAVVVDESTPDVITHYFPKLEQPTKKRTLEDLQTTTTVESDGKENNDDLANSQPTPPPKEEEAKRREGEGRTAEQNHHHPKAKSRRKEKKTKDKPFRKKDLERKFGHPNKQCAWAAQIPLGQRASY